MGNWLSNPFVDGGIVLMIIGGVLAYFRNIPEKIFGWIRQRLVTEVEVLGNDPVFTWVHLWLAKHPYVKRARSLIATVAAIELKMYEDRPVAKGDSAQKRKLPSILFTPAPGQHFIFYKGRPIWIGRSREKVTPSEGGRSYGWYVETLNIRTFGRDVRFNQYLIRTLLEEARDLALEKEEGISIYVAGYDYWRNLGLQPPRDPASVILDGDQFERLLDDCKRFMASSDWYNSMGVPYRRGYELYGEPGSGKTSTILALASALSVPIYILNLSGWGSSDSALVSLLNDVQPGSIVLIEDIDAVFDGRDRKEASKELTFSGLLNAIDGVASATGRMLFMTTNHHEVLDPALVRPGRCDLQLRFGNATHNQIQRLFQRFYPAFEKESNEFASYFPERTISMAQLQEYFLSRRDDPYSALRDVITLQTYQISSVAAD